MEGEKAREEERERKREQEREQEQEQERSLGRGTAGAPLEPGDDHAQARANHKLHDEREGARGKGRSEQRARTAEKSGMPREESDGDGVDGRDGAAAAAGMGIDAVVADRTSGKRSIKTPPHFSFDRENSGRGASAASAKTKPAKKANDDGAGSGAGSGGDGAKDPTSVPRRYRIASSNQLPPGWKVMRIEQPDKSVSFFTTCAAGGFKNQ